MDTSGAANAARPLPDLILWSKPGCHLCDEARDVLEGLLQARRKGGLPAPPLVERDITADPAWEREFFLTIPVVELDGRRVELATSAAKLRALLATLDAAPELSPAPTPV